ncbi:MAG: cobalamin-dependent protein [Chloroflexota bacterium]
MQLQVDKLAILRAAYLEAMRSGSGRSADHVIEKGLDQQVSPNQIYLDIFQPVAYEIGKLWQRNQFTVAQEHLATAIIERQMGQLHPYFLPEKKRQRTIVLGSISGELHRVGVRMVADFFEQDGWTVYYLGATTPVEEFVGMARDVHADLIGISTQMVFNIPQVSGVVQELDRRGLAGMPVIVGGLPFNQQPDLYRALNVRFSAVNAAAAVEQANLIFENKGVE